MKTSALRPGRRLNGRKPAHAHAPASANARCASSGWTVTASIAKNPNAIAASVAASPSMLSSRLNAFVIPTSQKIASGHATMCVWISCDAGAGREHDHRGGDLQRELRASARARARRRRARRRRGARCRRRCPAICSRGRDRAGRRRRPRSRRVSPAKIPTPPKSGVGTSCQRSARRDGDEPPLQPRREEEPDRERGSRESGDRREGAHEFGR